MKNIKTTGFEAFIDCLVNIWANVTYFEQRAIFCSADLKASNFKVPGFLTSPDMDTLKGLKDCNFTNILGFIKKF